MHTYHIYLFRFNVKNLLPVLLISLFTTLSLYAAGVKAGTVIENQALLSYEIEAAKFEIKSNKTKDVVDQLIDLNLYWLDEAYVRVHSGVHDALLSFKITNTGNGEDSFEITVNNSADSDIHIANKKIYIDTNQNSVFDKEDKKFKDITLEADQSTLLFISSDIPKTKSHRQSLAKITCKAASKRGGSGTKGTVHEKMGINQLDAIDGLNGGIATGEGVFIVRDMDKSALTKTLTVTNKYGTNEPVEGAIITYEVLFSLPYKKSAKDIKITDVIPDHTDYVQKSLKLDGKPLSDVCDKDAGQYDASSNMIIVTLDKVIYPQEHTVSFSVKLR